MRIVFPWISNLLAICRFMLLGLSFAIAIIFEPSKYTVVIVHTHCYCDSSLLRWNEYFWLNLNNHACIYCP